MSALPPPPLAGITGAVPDSLRTASGQLTVLGRLIADAAAQYERDVARTVSRDPEVAAACLRPPLLCAPAAPYSSPPPSIPLVQCVPPPYDSSPPAAPIMQAALHGQAAPPHRSPLLYDSPLPPVVGGAAARVFNCRRPAPQAPWRPRPDNDAPQQPDDGLGSRASLARRSCGKAAGGSKAAEGSFSLPCASVTFATSEHSIRRTLSDLAVRRQLNDSVQERPMLSASCSPMALTTRSPSAVSAAAQKVLVQCKGSNNLASLYLWQVFLRDDASEAEPKTSKTIAFLLSSMRESMQRASVSSLSIKTSGSSSSCFSMRGGCVGPCAMHPDSASSLIWGMVGALLIFYDLITIPMQAFPQMPHWSILAMIAWSATSYWILDIIRCFFVGFERDGTIILSPPRLLAQHYLMTWFCADLIIVAVDIFCIIFLDTEGTATRSWHLSKTFRFLRFLRLLRLVRVLKVVKVLAAVMDGIQSQIVLFSCRVCCLLAIILLGIHTAACYWYAIGTPLMVDALETVPIHLHTTWLIEHGFQDTDLGTPYVASIYWVVSLAGTSRSDVGPTNTLETCFACTLAMLWMLLFWSTTSQITIWMINLQNACKAQLTQDANIRKYLSTNGVSTELTNKVMHFFRQNYSKRMRRIHEADIEFISDLPLHMRIKLHKEVFWRIVQTHPLFSHFGQCAPDLLVSICHLAMTEMHRPAGQDVFVPGEAATHMFHVATGDVHYYHANCKHSGPVSAGAWICEVVMWRKWVVRGWLVTVTSSEFITLDIAHAHSIFQEVQRRDPDVFDSLRTYAFSVCEFFREDNGFCSIGDLASFDATACAESDVWANAAAIEQIAQEAFEVCLAKEKATAMRRSMFGRYKKWTMSQ